MLAPQTIGRRLSLFRINNYTIAKFRTVSGTYFGTKLPRIKLVGGEIIGNRSHRKPLNLNSFTAAQYSKIIVTKLRNYEELKSKSYEEVNKLFIEAGVLAEADLNKIKLNGEHLWSAIDAHIKSGETSNMTMIAKLMQEGKVISNSVANNIAHWLKSFIEPHDSKIQSGGANENLDELVHLKNIIEEKLKKMRETIPLLPSQLYTPDRSELRMVFKKEQILPSICLGPPLPEDKYNEYSEYLMKESKAFTHAVLSLIEPSGYGKTHFMLDCARKGIFAIPIGTFFQNSNLSKDKMLVLIRENKSRDELIGQTQKYASILLETLNRLRSNASLGEFMALLLLNGVGSEIATYVDGLYAGGYTARNQSFNNVIFVLDEAQKLMQVFPNSITRINPTLPLGNAITLLTAACRERAPVVLMSTKRTFDNMIDAVVSGGNSYNKISFELNRLPPIEYGKIIPFLDKFINTENISQYDKLIMQQILQGQVRYLDYFIDHMSQEYAKNNKLSVNEIVRKSIGKIVKEFGTTPEVEGLLVHFEKKLNSMTKMEAIMTELLTVFGKLQSSQGTDDAFEEYMQNNGIGYVKLNENNTFYYRDLIISAKYQMRHLNHKMIARWVLELDYIVKRLNYKVSHLFELFLAVEVCKPSGVFNCTKRPFFARDLNVLKSKNDAQEQELRFASLLVSEMKEKSYKQNGLLDKLIALPAEQNGPDFVTICQLMTKEGGKEDYLLSASATLQSKDIYENGKQRIRTMKEKIVKDVIKTNPWFYWINQKGEVESKLDREHIEKYLNADNSCLKCLRLIFLPNISLKKVKSIFGVTTVTEVYLRIQEIWRNEYKKTFTQPQLEQILREDTIDDEKNQINEFTVQTKRDRIVFVTQDHLFFQECKNDELSNLLFTIFSCDYEVTGTKKKNRLEKMMELKQQLSAYI